MDIMKIGWWVREWQQLAHDVKWINLTHWAWI